MTEVGSLQIGGSIETENIERGLKRVETGFKDVDSAGKGVNSDFVRMHQQASRLGRTFGLMALTGAGAMVAIAKGAPATAGAMAKIELGTTKLQFAIGEALKEEFNWFADKLDWLAGWVQAHPDIFSALTTSVLSLAGAFVAFKIGGAIYAGVSSLSGIIGGLSATITSPTFLAALAAIGVAAAAWGYINKLGAEAKAYSEYTNFASGGGALSEVQYGQAGGFRYFESGTRGFSGSSQGNQWNIANASFNFGETQMNMKNMTLSWEDTL